MQYGGSVNQYQGWGGEWDDGVDIPSPWECMYIGVIFWAERGVGKRWDTQRSNAAIASSALRVPALVKTDPELQLVILLWMENTPPDLGFLYEPEGGRDNSVTWVNFEVKT